MTVLAGGVGGAKLAHGASRVTDRVTVVVNTADDARIHGLWVSPDLDTVMYTLAGIANPTTGWGIAGETYTTLEALRRLGADTWFMLGDQDLATHLARTARLADGASLSQVTAELATALGVTARLLPATDDPLATMVDTPAGRLDFQDYFVRRKHQDDVLGVHLDGVDDARPAPGVLPALTGADVVLLAPSNPIVSVGPVLAVPGVREALRTSPARRVGVSPLIGGRAVKGPAAQMLAGLGHEVSALGVARLYVDVLDVWCIDTVDAHLAPAITDLGLTVHVTDTMMRTDHDRERLATELVDVAGR
ncbi:2-phospho-L-lactate transferase [Cellulomonas bogoriensis 69B4 = DSM 16987]|uniref:2-phospho-L-lactate transferase n=1 Tax=Cellulomonas bogoriensis 69B4 = DSM 16987 TaxID=1386082 RepID=A0A0A0BYJ3_9CELL|nr:2-phospho-L-lactate transferase [Cellulomonas bogoriensis 69B4 = DSM 16987]